MRTFIADIFPKLQNYSQKLDNLTLLTNQHWVSIDDILSSKTVYIFRDNKDLLISTNGRVEKAKWDYLGNRSLLIDRADEIFLFKHGFFDENVLALKVDSSNEYAVFVNENKYDGDLNSLDKVLDFLRENYLGSTLKPYIERSTGHMFQNEAPVDLTPEQSRMSQEINVGDKFTASVAVFAVVLFVIWLVLSN